MIKQLEKLTSYQKSRVLSLVHKFYAPEDEATIWIDDENLVLVLDNDDGPEDLPVEYAGYKCQDCGRIIADYLDYSGRDLDTDRCPHCNSHYDYTEKELAEL